MQAWTDAHNHLQDPRLGAPAPIIGDMRAVGIQRCITNATRESDWQAVEKLATDYRGFVVPAFGIHPWHAHTAAPGWQSRLEELLKSHPTASIGECGIDGWISAPAMDMQRPVFIDQIRLARKLERPLTIHCLKAWGALLEILLAEAPLPSFLIHSYGGSIETARRLLPLGAYFSLSGHFLHERKAAVLEAFKQLPPERILVETDAPDMRPPDFHLTHALPSPINHPANLPAIASALARHLNLDTETFAMLTRDNAARCFGI